MLESIASRLAANPQRTLALLTIAVLLPFVSKPFNMDDPLFIWAAHQIQAHPADPFGFNVEWYWREFPMWKVTENPPLAAYYIALAAGCIGWSEIALHLAFLLPALAAILGTFRLARHFCNMPMTAALAVLFTPAFLVSSTTIMCDVPMLAFWVWAVVFWVEGLEKNCSWRLFAAGCLIALELVRDRTSKERATELQEALARECLNRGLLADSSTTSYNIQPSLVTPLGVIEVAAQIVESALETVLAGAAARGAE